MPPPFGWPQKLSELMDQEFPGDWMYSGSFAMFCYATIYKLECRDPADIDIIIRGSKTESMTVGNNTTSFTMSNLSLAFFEVKQKFKGTKGHEGTKNGYVDDCCINGDKKVKIDFGTESAKLGLIDADCMKIRVEGVEYRLISPTKLLQGKTALAETDEKHKADLALMGKIVAAMTPTAQ